MAFTIEYGPSKWDLMLALFERKIVTFDVGGGIKIYTSVRALSNESAEKMLALDRDTSIRDDTWLIEGNHHEPTRVPDNHFIEKPEEMIAIYAAYSTSCRKGVLNTYSRSEGIKFRPGPITMEWENLISGGRSPAV